MTTESRVFTPEKRTFASLRRDLRIFAKYHLVRQPHRYPAPAEADMGVELLAFDLAAHVRALQAYEPHFSSETLGTVAYAGREHAITWVRNSAPVDAPRLLVLSGVHGNEHAGIVCVPRILERLVALGQPRVAVGIVTPVNPIGAVEGSRFNGQGFDINRDFRRFETEEARIVRRVIADFRPSLIVSLHEGPQDASFVFVNRSTPAGLAERAIAQLAARGVTLSATDYFGRTLPSPGYSPVSLANHLITRVWAATLGMMHTGMYADELSVGELTLESSWRGREEDRVRAHVELVCALVAELAPLSQDA
ncbi:MAG: DUF2817 domain-containing protein [Sandaracinaceae bacterium]|jgi:hypothetical protein|nr:DUF2817 domain-containing protein [Sandaracinaceae bacterium]MBP7683951.1 DUF2817 domain-containing protein [Deltaproteobacteria bacterium]MBK6807733.1 DUF2817 domain-containing protein [Sandaracinaceae bacterium]MBK7154105.1 DUF2817 domain-containing protein [Sandaracinaceae bacterium]MBK7776250.1 DUF2817 domain-containing protein [Sandaracinaceae bacterium]